MTAELWHQIGPAFLHGRDAGASELEQSSDDEFQVCFLATANARDASSAVLQFCRGWKPQVVECVTGSTSVCLEWFGMEKPC